MEILIFTFELLLVIVLLFNYLLFILDCIDNKEIKKKYFCLCFIPYYYILNRIIVFYNNLPD